MAETFRWLRFRRLLQCATRIGRHESLASKRTELCQKVQRCFKIALRLRTHVI